jgi:phytoene dehydrogenase-like protein
MHVVVAGAGLAGVVAARHLAEAGHEVQVFEERESVGGRVRSTPQDGYIFDRGFQTLFTAYPAVRRELDLDALELGYFTPGATLAAPGHRSTFSDPLRDPGAAVDTLLNPDVRIGDPIRLFRLQRDLKRRALADVLAADEDRTIHEYLADAGFSRRFVERFAAPFYGGITLDRSLETSATVFEATFKMLSEGGIALPADGMAAIPEHLAARARSAGAAIETGREVRAVGSYREGVELEVGGETVDADAAVVATDPHTAEDLTGVSTPDGGTGCVTLHCSLPAHKSLDTGTRILLNSDSDRPNTVAPSSAVQPSYAPAGRQLLVATFLGSEARSASGETSGERSDPRVHQDAEDEALAEQVRSTLASWYPETTFDALQVERVDRVDFAQFPQPPGFRAGLPAVDEPEGRVYLAGDYTRWSSIQGALESGRVAARAAMADL